MIIFVVYCVFIIEFLIGILFLFKYCNLRKKSPLFKLNIAILLVLIVLVRVYGFESNLGLDMDEAMGGINSWSIGKYGVDYFNLMHHPMYLFAWGSGMNILYPLITVPFVKIFGLSVTVYRVPMVFLSIAGAFALTGALLKTRLSSKQVILIISLLMLSPWSIQSSRWAIESNLFPILMMFVTSFFIMFYESKSIIWSNIYLTTMSVLIALSAYAYSNNWIFLGLFVLGTYIWLCSIKKINLRCLLTQFFCMFLIVSPIILFIYVNFISHHSMYFLGIGIPKLAAARSAFVISNGHVLKSIFHNVWRGTVMIITGYDGVTKVAMPIFGAFYPFMFLFCLIGIIKRFRYYNYIEKFMVIMMLSSIPTFMLIEPSWTHFNALMIPVLYFEAVGVDYVFKSRQEINFFAICFSCLLVMMMRCYFNNYQDLFHNGEQNTPAELKKIINEHRFHKNVYLVTDKRINSMNSGAMFVVPIYYNQINPFTFHKETAGVKKKEFMSYDHFGRWHIVSVSETKHNVKLQKDSVFIVQNGANKSVLPHKITKISHYEYYSVYE